jgi:uncharacterized protein
MAISQELLKILACPVCKGDIRHLEKDDELFCLSCHRAYPIRDGIPVMLVEEARVRDDVKD